SRPMPSKVSGMTSSPPSACSANAVARVIMVGLNCPVRLRMGSSWIGGSGEVPVRPKPRLRGAPATFLAHMIHDKAPSASHAGGHCLVDELSAFSRTGCEGLQL